MTAPEPLAPNSDEHVLRLLMPDWVREGRVLSAAFKTRKPDHEKYLGKPSVFLKERLPDESGDVLHVGNFASFRRASLDLGSLRPVSRLRDNERLHCGFGIEMTPNECQPPLDDFSDAHASLDGPTWDNKCATALAAAFTELGEIER